MLDSNTSIYTSVSDLPADFIVKNKETFTIKATLIHGGRYDYTLVEYKNSHSKVKIICKEHGVFEQTPSKHIIGRGCPICKGGVKYTLEQFLKKAIQIHGVKYDYSLVEYKNNTTKIKIICKEHGVFEQTPYLHLRGAGCSACSGNKKSNTEEFIEKARKIHGEKYDYSLVEYKTSKKNIKIICPIHGIFDQTPSSHLNGGGCILCGIQRSADAKYFTTEEFIEKARIIHNDKYNYSLICYINSTSKIKIICPTHGVFEQKPIHHLQGKGCQKCKISTIKEKSRKTTQQFINESKIVHKEFYKYDNVIYINSLSKVLITCPIHGDFLQLPSNHLRGHGCPICFKERNLLEWIDRYKTGTIYLLECYNETERFLKIGITSRTIEQRYYTNTRMPYKYDILFQRKSKSTTIVELESYIKGNFDLHKPEIFFGGSLTESLKIHQKESILNYLSTNLQ